MTTHELKQWMKKNKKGTAWIAAKTGFTMRTIQRFIKGQTHASPVLSESLKRLIQTK